MEGSNAEFDQYKRWAHEAWTKFDRDSPGFLAFDTETTGVSFFDAPFCVSMAWADAAGGSIPLEAHYFELGIPYVEEAVKSILAEAPNLVCHNSKFDFQKVALVGLYDWTGRDPHTVWDTECLYHLLDEHGTKGLKDLAERVLGLSTDEEEVLKVERRKLKMKKSDGYHLLPREVLIPYAVKDAEFTIQLFGVLYNKVTGVSDLARINALEQSLTFTLLGMESRGMGLDIDYVRKEASAYANKALEAEILIRDITGDEEFNPNSPKQISEYFERMGMAVVGTDKATLKQTDSELAEAILDLRHLRKIHGTYLKPMLEESRDGILHPNYRQHGTRTGRMSSGGAIE